MTTRSTRSKAAATAASVKQEPHQLSSPPATPVPLSKKSKELPAKSKKPLSKIKAEPLPVANSSRKRKHVDASSKVKEETDDVPHNLGKGPEPTQADPSSESKQPAKKLKKTPKKAVKKEVLDKELNNPQNKAIADKLVAQFTNTGKEQPETSIKQTRKGKKDTAYGHTPGTTPFPDYARPTPEECQIVTQLLSSVHGRVSAPETVQQGSMDVAGCGEVPHVLEALIRTRLSANTNGDNSSRAFQGIVRTYGTVTDRAGRTMVDWNAVRLGDQKKLFTAIEKGGLANVKSKDIKKILDMVYEENQERRKQLQSKNEHAPGEKSETEEQKQKEVENAKDDLISLDHVHLLSQEEAFQKLISYPGIGAKTASCVLLFCLQRPSFAVDTHVWRLSSWLGWVPKNATRDQTFSHCEVRVPDDLKYPLHHLLVKHGKQCPKCMAKVNKAKVNPKLGDECVIDHLMERFNHKETGGKAKKSPKRGGKKSKKEDDEEQEEETELSELSELSSELSDLGSEDEES